MSKNRPDRSRASLLVEVGTEELPPASLVRLGEAFSRLLFSSLSSIGLCNQTPRWFATPRRLAVLIPEVAFRQPDQVHEKRGPALSVAFDSAGQPTRAAEGFAKSCGVTVDKLRKVESDKGGWLVSTSRASGERASALIPECVGQALAELPIAKRMRWGEGRAEFVRPVHWLVIIQGTTAIKCEILGVNSGVFTYGHRFLSEKPIRVSSADSYVSALQETGFVVADFAERREIVRQHARRLGRKAGGQTIIEDGLLNTVTGLVEWPHALLGNFDADFLKIPSEVLVSSMRDHQKFFHLVDQSGNLLPKFIAICNIKSRKMGRVREGNERVLHARLSDAKFFWEEDCQNKLSHWVEDLKEVSFHAQLGTLYEKTLRLKKLSASIAAVLGWESSRISRAAHICKADLASQMVGEFPELQGIMGYHYSRQQREPKEVSIAIAEHYLPKHAGDTLPASRAGKILALTDKIDTLTGIFSTGEDPTGEKDPYALRRAALGVIRILVEKKIPLDIVELVDLSISTYNDNGRKIEQDTRQRVSQFIVDRYHGYFGSTGFTKDEINAVLELGIIPPLDFYRRLRAVSKFRRSRSAESLSEANKRVSNIIRKSGQDIPLEIDSTLFECSAEETLSASLVEVSATLTPLIERGDYARALAQLALLREPVDRFFTDVMVLTDDSVVRTNRLALLNQLSQLLVVVADISKLQPPD